MKKLKKNNRSSLRIRRIPVLCLLLLWVPVLFFSCNQDPIFLGIAKEEAPIDPSIPGSPTKMVTFGNKMYVAARGSSTINSYGNEKWEKNETGFPIMDLAVTKTYLYVLDGSKGIHKMDKNKILSDVSGNFGNDQPIAIYGTDEYLFVGGYHNGDYTVFSIKDDGSALIQLKTSSGRLTGAVHNGSKYYFSTESGIFETTPSITSSATNKYDSPVMGMLAVGTNSKIAAVGRDGELINSYDGTTFKATGNRLGSGERFTGAMAVWENTDGNQHLLLLGVQGSGTSSTHGYRELQLKEDGDLPLGNDGDTLSGNLLTPGEDRSYSSVSDDIYKYRSSIGAHAVNSILQVSNAVDSNRIIFASTSNKGLWSYRKGSWNAEP